MRKSFRKHDLYFTVPWHYYCCGGRCRYDKDNENGVVVGDDDDAMEDNAVIYYNGNDDDDIVVVPDVTHTLQRMFMELLPGVALTPALSNGPSLESATTIAATQNRHCRHRRHN